ncbi:hypothetical protein [Thermohalobacter berrensis]|uniref:Uncharacterized protein n=1 Tax=Thermohalobacter berrensis TaxID=99594 RepID=A0A419T156_9FIRM|nr:hypothetical protein [Thermohalobacter berrensis]RKD31205.1 hypothetical protein BET03_03500 [Thermohalobacter berrensis]
MKVNNSTQIILSKPLSSSANISKTIIVDKRNEIDSTKASFEKCVVMYEEKIIITLQDNSLYTNMYNLNSVTSKLETDTKYVTFQGVTIELIS